MSIRYRQWFQQLSLAVLLVVFSMAANSHESGFVTLQLQLGTADQTRFSVELDVLELELAVGLDADGDGSIVWQEYRQRRDAIEQYIVGSISLLSATEPCLLSADRNSSGIRQGRIASVLTAFTVSCAQPLQSLTVQNRLLADIDSNAKAVLTISSAAGQQQTRLLETGETTVAVDQLSVWSSIVSFVVVGVEHIIGGLDHLAFLLLLLLPAAKQGGGKQRLLAMTGIITAFTVAHSVTLALSSWGYLGLPARIAEVVIAASVVLAAVMNCVSPKHQLSWFIAYSFGLIHGFGFAGALAELAGTGSLPWYNLLAFNLGVELGQIALMLITLPLLVLLGSRIDYSRYVVRTLSTLVAVVGGVWMLERLGVIAA